MLNGELLYWTKDPTTPVQQIAKRFVLSRALHFEVQSQNQMLNDFRNQVLNIAESTPLEFNQSLAILLDLEIEVENERLRNLYTEYSKVKCSLG